jgi:hypothetical protein
MSNNKKPKAKKAAAPAKSGLVVKSGSVGASHAKSASMIPAGNFSSVKKGGAQNNAPRKAQ